MMLELRRLNADPDKLAEKIGLFGTEVDATSRDGIQILLHRIDTNPQDLPPEVVEFAETATKTIKTRTNITVSRSLPWFVQEQGMNFASLRSILSYKTRVDIKRGERIGAGGFSLVYKGQWIPRNNQEVAIKVFGEGETINVSVDSTLVNSNSQC